MQSKFGRAGLALALCTSMGCYKATFQADPSAPASARGAKHDASANFFLFGLVGDAKVDVSQFCPPEQVVEVQSKATFVDGLLGAITLGIYTPRTVTVTCASGSAEGDRTLWIGATEAGEPQRAWVEEAGQRRRLAVRRVGAAQWQLSEEG